MICLDVRSRVTFLLMTGVGRGGWGGGQLGELFKGPAGNWCALPGNVVNFAN
jgi:hypothetical protein